MVSWPRLLHGRTDFPHPGFGQPRASDRRGMSLERWSPMNMEKAFLQAILDSPDDDAPRLVLADWLEEQGHSERAELIRVQCRLAALDEDDQAREALHEREQQLLS